MKKAISFALTLALDMSLLADCGSGGKDNSSGSTPNNDSSVSTPNVSTGPKEIRVALESDIAALDPRNANSTMTASVMSHIFSKLVSTDAKMNAVPDLAESWEQASDTEWKFKLQEGVKFHDGSELKAGDVKFSLERAKEMPRVKQLVEQIESITVEDDYNLTLHLSEPYALLLSALSHTGTSIIPEALVTAQGEAFWENPVGSGPYEIPGMGS